MTTHGLRNDPMIAWMMFQVQWPDSSVASDSSDSKCLRLCNTSLVPRSRHCPATFPQYAMPPPSCSHSISKAWACPWQAGPGPSDPPPTVTTGLGQLSTAGNQVMPPRALKAWAILYQLLVLEHQLEVTRKFKPPVMKAAPWLLKGDGPWPEPSPFNHGDTFMATAEERSRRCCWDGTCSSRPRRGAMRRPEAVSVVWIREIFRGKSAGTMVLTCFLPSVLEAFLRISR